MIRGFYSAATALDAASQAQEVSAHNLAHASTPGYRQQGLTFESFDRTLGRVLEPTGDLTGTKVGATFHDFQPGALESTGDTFDLALADNESFFNLSGPNGTVYSRAGMFRLGAGGRLETPGGYPFQGETGPIQVPPGTSAVRVGEDGTVFADSAPVGRLRLSRFGNIRDLTNVGPSLFTAGPNADPQPGTGRVRQGYRELSNVQPATSMVRMIADARYFDAAQRVLRMIGETIQLHTRPNG